MTSFLTSKSSDMQVSFPNDSGDMVEAPIPEQFRHTAALVGGKPVLSTHVLLHTPARAARGSCRGSRRWRAGFDQILSGSVLAFLTPAAA